MEDDGRMDMGTFSLENSLPQTRRMHLRTSFDQCTEYWHGKAAVLCESVYIFNQKLYGTSVTQIQKLGVTVPLGTLLAEVGILWLTFTHSYTETWCPHSLLLCCIIWSPFCIFLFFFFLNTCTLHFRIAECCPQVTHSHFCCTGPAALTAHQPTLKEER